MNRDLADKIARATLYEGYLLYPYRPSVKNRQRWTFGGVHPRSWTDARNGTDPCMLQTQVLIAGNGSAAVRVIIRFLQLVDRTVGQVAHPAAQSPKGAVPIFELVSSLTIGDTSYQPWQEAIEREVDAGEFDVNALVAQPAQIEFSFPAEQSTEHLHSPDGQVAGALIRQRHAIQGVIKIAAVHDSGAPRKITVAIENRTHLDPGSAVTRDQALMCSLISMHVLLGVRDGEFISLTDAPPQFQTDVTECKNVGLWPVLIGSGAEHDTMLASPIILYDYPQLAPESPGDLFDSTEIDEILTLRILTLTDDEKRAAAGIDSRASELLARTQSLAREQLMNLHGTIRGLRPVPQEQYQSPEQSHA